MINSNPAISLKFRNELTDVEGVRRDSPQKEAGDPFDPELIRAEKATALTECHTSF